MGVGNGMPSAGEAVAVEEEGGQRRRKRSRRGVGGAWEPWELGAYGASDRFSCQAQWTFSWTMLDRMLRKHERMYPVVFTS